jgi:hypothetical protein
LDQDANFYEWIWSVGPNQNHPEQPFFSTLSASILNPSYLNENSKIDGTAANRLIFRKESRTYYVTKGIDTL